jgi:hypothetical protein
MDTFFEFAQAFVINIEYNPIMTFLASWNVLKRLLKQNLTWDWGRGKLGESMGYWKGFKKGHQGNFHKKFKLNFILWKRLKI